MALAGDQERTVDVSDLTLDELGTISEPDPHIESAVAEVVMAEAQSDEAQVIDALAGLFNPGTFNRGSVAPRARLSVVPPPPDAELDRPTSAAAGPPPPPPLSVVRDDAEPTAQEPPDGVLRGAGFDSIIPTMSAEAPAPRRDADGFEYIAMQRHGGSHGYELHIAYAVGENAPSTPRVMRRLVPSDEPYWAIRRASLLAEGRLAIAVDHPNLVRVHDVGEDSDGPYVVRELVGGASLREIADRARGQIAVEAIIAIGLQLARALAHGHGAAGPDGEPFGLVHGDISPSTILMDRDGNPNLNEMGIARAGIEVLYSANGARRGSEG